MSATTPFSCKTKRAQWLIAHVGDEKSVITDLRVLIFVTNNNLFKTCGAVKKRHYNRLTRFLFTVVALVARRAKVCPECVERVFQAGEMGYLRQPILITLLIKLYMVKN